MRYVNTCNIRVPLCNHPKPLKYPSAHFLSGNQTNLAVVTDQVRSHADFYETVVALIGTIAPSSPLLVFVLLPRICCQATGPAIPRGSDSTKPEVSKREDHELHACTCRLSRHLAVLPAAGSLFPQPAAAVVGGKHRQMERRPCPRLRIMLFGGLLFRGFFQAVV